MTVENLNTRQRELLRELVERSNRAEFTEPFTLARSEIGQPTVLGIDDFDFEENDFRELVSTGLIEERPGRKSTLYRITGAGRQAVANDFRS